MHAGRGERGSGWYLLILVKIMIGEDGKGRSFGWKSQLGRGSSGLVQYTLLPNHPSLYAPNIKYVQPHPYLNRGQRGQGMIKQKMQTPRNRQH